MKKSMMMLTILTISFMLSGCDYMEESRAKSAASDYYEALIKEDYEDAFEQLYVYDYSDEHHPTDGTTLTIKEAKDFYLEKIEYLKERNYQIQDYELENVRYEDGHTFFLDYTLIVEVDGESYDHLETIDIWNGKVWVIEKEDPFAKYRDGKVNFDIESELQIDGI